MRRTMAWLPCLFSVSALVPRPADGQGTAVPPEPLDESEEVAIALSAAPPHLSSEAGVLVLRETGYERVRESGNGFECLVARSFTDPRILGPQCYDREAAATAMQALLAETRLLLSGSSSEEAKAGIGSMLAGGELRLPERVAIGYRLSTRQYLGEGPGRWFPHVRVYAPYLANDDVGGGVQHFRHPFVFPGTERTPFAYLVIIVADEFDPVF